MNPLNQIKSKEEIEKEFCDSCKTTELNPGRKISEESRENLSELNSEINFNIHSENNSENNSIDIFQNEEIIPDGPEVTLDDDTIFISDKKDSYKSLKEKIIEEELNESASAAEKYRRQFDSADNGSEKEKDSVLNPGIEKITEDDPDEKLLNDIRKRKRSNFGRNRNQPI